MFLFGLCVCVLFICLRKPLGLSPDFSISCKNGKDKGHSKIWDVYCNLSVIKIKCRKGGFFFTDIYSCCEILTMA